MLKAKASRWEVYLHMNLRYTFKQAFLQVARNKAMSLVSTFSIMAMLILLGISFVVVVNLATAMERVKDGYDEIMIHLEDDTPQWQIENIMTTLDDMPEVRETQFLPRDEALAQWRLDWGDRGYLLDTLQTNPLPDGVIVRLTDLEGADAVAERARNFPGVLEVRYFRDIVDALVRITDFIQLASLIIMGILIIICIVVVSNTIKLTVLARAEEINIMKYVGATNWFIRGPFLLEGIMIGIVSAAVSAGVIALVYSRIIQLLQVEVANMFRMQLVSVEFLTYNLFWIFLALGVSIGAVGSIISMRRFLDT
jgi:cell division transport system permease protein